MAVTVPDVVRALIAAAPEDVPAKRWLAELLPGLDLADEIRTAAPDAPAEDFAPFASLEERHEARGMLRANKGGREIADWFGLDIGPVAEWAARERGGAE
jgi:hypothetical protein